MTYDLDLQPDQIPPARDWRLELRLTATYCDPATPVRLSWEVASDNREHCSHGPRCGHCALLDGDWTDLS